MKTYTPQQERIFNNIVDGVGHTVVIARAGAGKTSTIEEAIRRLPTGEKVIYLAFNAQVAAEAKRRIRRPNTSIMTCHGFGLNVLSRNLGYVAISKGRGIDLAKDLFPQKADNQKRWALIKVVAYAKGSLVSTADDVDNLIERHDFKVVGDREAFIQGVLNLLERAREQVDCVDYDDMIYLPIALGLEVPQYDRVFIDEAQDLNKAQTRLAVAAAGGRICAIGDDRQAIYGWRGAEPDGLTKLTKKLQATVLPLSTSFRCAKRVVGEARQYVPDIEALEDAPEGDILVKTLDTCFNQVEYGDFVISRTNAPLVKLALKLVADGCRVTILGRDVASSLIDVIFKLQAPTVAALKSLVGGWAVREEARLLSQDPPNERAAKLVKDRAECIVALCDKSRSTAEVVQKAKELFADPGERSANSCVVLSTAHQAKGLEADRVWLLQNTFLLRDRLTGEVPLEEKNMAYVAITRARKALIFMR